MRTAEVIGFTLCGSDLLILPGTGRGTADGGGGVPAPDERHLWSERSPSTTLRVVPLPLRGRMNNAK